MLFLACNPIFMCILQKLSLRLHSPRRHKAAQSWCGKRSKWEWLSCVTSKWFWLTRGCLFPSASNYIGRPEVWKRVQQKNSHLFLSKSPKVKAGSCDNGKKLHPNIGGDEAAWRPLVCTFTCWLCSLHSFYSRRQFSQSLINWETNKLHHYELIFHYYQARTNLLKSCSW